MLVIFFVICIAPFLYLGLPWIYGRLARLLLKYNAVRSKALVLTFDDGPGNRLTPAILNILAESNAKATFFLLGKNITGREAIVRQIATAGHEICSHGYDHLHQWKVSPIRAIRDIKHSWQAIDEVLGNKRGKYPFRPPYGKLNLVCLLYLLSKGVPICYWSVVSGDILTLDKLDSQLAAILARKDGGAVILIHDFDRSEDTTDSMVLESVGSVLEMARETGMRLLSVTELLNAPK